MQMHYDSLMNKFTWQVTLSRIKVSIEGSSNDARLGDKATKDALEKHNNEDNTGIHFQYFSKFVYGPSIDRIICLA